MIIKKFKSKNGELYCPITGNELIYIENFSELLIMDASSFYQPINSYGIYFESHPFSWNIFRLVDSPTMTSKVKRFFRLIEGEHTEEGLCYEWQELKQVPHDNRLFPIDDEGEEWITACNEGLEKHKKHLEREEYLRLHPEEDKRIKSKLIANEIISVQPMNPPLESLFYYELNYKNPNENN